MRVLVSWSGPRSKALALGLSEFIGSAIQRTDPWMSERNIRAGQRWSDELANRLNDTDFGVICLTPENLKSVWLLFEAGALSKTLQEGRVVPVLLDLDVADLELPLAQFQAVTADKAGLLELVLAINDSLPEGQMDKIRLNDIFNGLWPGVMEPALSNALNVPGPAEGPKQRSEKELLEEVLAGVRSLQRSMRTGGDSGGVEDDQLDWQDHFIKAVNLANSRGGPDTDRASLRSYAIAIAALPPGVEENILSRLYAYRAAMLKRLGRLREAENDLRLAQELATEPREIEDALYNLASVRVLQDDLAGALTEVHKLVARDSRWVERLRQNRYFAAVRDDPAFKQALGEVPSDR